MGASRTKVFMLILFEGILALIGWLVGMAICYLGMEVMSGYLKSSFKYSFNGFKWITEHQYVLGISIVLGIVAAIIPAIGASSADINKTLSEKQQ